MNKLRWQRKFSALLDWFLLNGIVLVASVHCSNHDSSLFSVAVAAADLYSSQSQYASRAPPVPPPCGMRFVNFVHQRLKEVCVKSHNHGVTVYPLSPQLTLLPNYAAWWQRQTCKNDFDKVILDSAAPGIEPAISNHMSYAISPFAFACYSEILGTPCVLGLLGGRSSGANKDSVSDMAAESI